MAGELPNDLPAFHDQAGCKAAKLPDPPTAVNILTLLLESERCAIRSWSAVCDMTFGKDPRTYDMAARILNEEIEHEAWFIELLAHERDGKSIPSGHFRRGEPGEAPYSKNRGFYNRRSLLSEEEPSRFPHHPGNPGRAARNPVRKRGAYMGCRCAQRYPSSGNLPSGQVSDMYREVAGRRAGHEGRGPRIFPQDRAAGFILLCTTKPRSDLAYSNAPGMGDAAPPQGAGATGAVRLSCAGIRYHRKDGSRAV